jgi:hypothetical protein
LNSNILDLSWENIENDTSQSNTTSKNLDIENEENLAKFTSQIEK